MKTFILILSLFICGVTKAATYYISPTGNDVTGNGSIGNPWRTLFKATSTVITAGNIIHINAGNYTETQQCNLRVGVSIEGDGSAITIVKSDITGQWSSFLELQSPNNTNGNQSISGVTFDGQYVSETNNKTWMGIWITGRSNVIIHDCSIINFRDRGVIFAGTNATNPLSDPGNYATGNMFYNNTVLNSAQCTNGYGAGLLNIGGQQGMEIYNNTMIQDQRVNFKNGWPIKYWENGWLKGVKIYNNTLKKAYYQGTYPGQNGDWDFAIELFNLQGLEISNNNIQGSIDLNYNYKGTYPFSVWIHHNTLDHPTINTKFEAGIILEFATQSALIEDNVINNSSSGIQFNTRGPGNSGGYTYPPPAGGYSALTDNVIRRNLFSNIYTPNIGSSGVGIGIFSEGTDDPYINNLYIYNNTIVAKAGNAPWYGLDFSSQPNGNVNNVFIRNNIVNGFMGAWIVGSNGAGNTNINGMTLTHNNAFGNGSNTPNWPGGNPTNYTYNNNLSVNPLFISILSFLLQSISPCINTGVNVGLPFTGSAPDMGYAEFGGVPPGPTAPLVGTITQPTCAVATGSVVLSGLPATGTWTLTRTPGGTTTTGTGAGTTITGLPAATTYTYTVSNASGTSMPSANIVINAQPTAPAAPTVGTITQPTCAVATGSVILSGLPATGTWTLTRTPGGTTTTGTGTTTTITGLATGTYTYSVTNAAGCISTASANVVINAQPAAPAAPTVGTITQPTCAIATGSVVLNGLPATGTWTLTRSPGGTTTTGTGTTTTITGLATGTYTYTVTNAAGCTSAASGNVVISTAAAAPTAPTVGTITQPTCTVTTGSVVLNGLPATGTWTLTRSPGGVTTTGTGTTTTITGLAAGIYTYTVTNAAGCTSAASANVVLNAAATPTAPTIGTITQPTCAVATGSVAISGLPATGTWTLTVSPGGTTTTGTGTTTTVAGLAPGTYTYTVTNAAGCTSAASGNVVINAQPALPTAPIVGTITQPTCAVATGSVVLNGLPVTGTWTLTRTPGAVNITGTGTTTTIAGLAPGTYTYTVTNAAGCTSAASGNVVITPQASSPAAPTVGTITQPTCAVATGSVVLNGLPATGTWTLTRTPGAVTTTGTGTTSTITGLATGTYTYTVTNAAGCISIGSANIVINVQPATPAVPIVGTITQPGCAVATGSIVLNGLPATGTWTLTTTPGGTTSGTGTTTTITGLATGTYTFVVTNSTGCTSAVSGNVVINAQPATPTAPIVGTISQPTCAVATGSVTLSGLPATGTWTLTRTPGAVNITGTGTTTTIAGLNPGTYTYTVTNAGGCTSAASGNVLIIPQASSPAAPTVGTLTQPTCAVATGSVVLNGLPATGTWTLTRTPGAVTTTGTGTSTTITALASGTYTYTVTNAAGCISVGSANIVINAQPTTPVAPTIGTITQPGCTVATGSVVLTALPATGTWTLTTTPGGTTSGTGTTTTITGLATGSYIFTVTNASGCISAASASVVINAQPATPSAPIVGTIIQPTGTVTTGSVDLSGLPATGTWTLTRTPGAVNISGTGTTTTIAGLNPGTYTYTVTNASGCISAPSGNVVINGGAPNIAPDADAGPDQTITLPINAVIVSGSGTDVDGIIVGYLWTKVSGPAAGGIITNPTTAATSITGLVQGVYTFELRVTDNVGAFGRDTMEVTVNSATNIAPIANAGSDQAIVAVSITAPNSTSLSGSGIDPDGTIVAYNWTKISGPAAGTITNPNLAATSVTGLMVGVYEFELRVTDNGGAFGRDTMQITISAPPNIAPVANAGPDRSLVLPANSTSLTGSGSDADGTIATYEWKQISGPSNNVLFSLYTAVTYLNNLVEGTYEFELTVTDNQGAQSKDNVLVIVTATPVNAIHINDASLYPNPVVGITTLDIKSEKQNAKLSIIITDMQGKNVYRKELTATQFNFSEKIDMSNLGKGTYIVTVYFANGERQTIKAIKQ